MPPRSPAIDAALAIALVLSLRPLLRAPYAVTSVIGNGNGAGCCDGPFEPGVLPAGAERAPGGVGLALGEARRVLRGVALAAGDPPRGWGAVKPGAKLDAPRSAPSLRA